MNTPFREMHSVIMKPVTKEGIISQFVLSHSILKCFLSNVHLYWLLMDH